MAALAAGGDTPSSGRDKVVVLFYPQDESPMIPKRRLTLTPDCPVVRIGRSSKVQSKGFIPASDNAWFDNPVVSREHAEITAKFDENPVSVYLKDTGSFHGTYHTNAQKDAQLVAQQQVKLNDNDIIRFGMEIVRADKTYPACSVRFETERLPSRFDVHRRRCFTVPDDVDEEEEQDEEQDENNEEEEEAPLYPKLKESNIDSPNTKFMTKVARAAETMAKTTPTRTITGSTSVTPMNSRSFVDLTIDDDSVALGCKTNSNAIDLTSKLNCDSDVTPHTGLVEATLQSSTSVTQSEPVLHIISSDDDMSDYDGITSDDSLSLSSGRFSEISESRILDQDSTLSDSEREFEQHNRVDSDDELYYYPYADSSEGSSIDEDCDERATDFDEEDEEDEHDEQDEQDEVDEDVSDDDDELESDNGSTESNDHSIQEASDWKLAKAIFSSYNRHPSPSDAALIKSNRPLFRPLWNNVPDQSRAQQLGEMTGKFEYFAAREQNRATVNQHHAPAPISAIRETLQPTQSNVTAPEIAEAPEITEDARSPSPTLSCVPDKNCNDDQHCDCLEQDPKRDLMNEEAGRTFYNARHDPILRLEHTSKEVHDIAPCTSETADSMSIKLGEIEEHQYSAWAIAGDEFINKPPPEEPSSSRTISVQAGEPDMTSAFKYQQSKQFSWIPMVETRRLLIQDLLDGESKPGVKGNTQGPDMASSSACEVAEKPRTPTKRSYEEAFKQDENVTTTPSLPSLTARDQAESTPVKASVSASPMKASAQNAVVGPESQDITVTIDSHTGSSRPSKRMRLAAAAKVAACVALGGAATFSYLVNTAPVF